MNIIVTGGAGFIGSHTTDRLIGLGHEVAVIDNLSTGKKSNLNPKASFYDCDIRDKEVLDIFMEHKPNAVIHDAAQISVRISVEDPMQDADINIKGSLNIIEACRKAKVPRFIFASSGGTVYGEQKQFPAEETHPLAPLSPYGVAKLAVENYLYYYNKNYGLDYISLRYGNIYGPRQDPLGEAGVVAIFSKRILEGKEPTINGDGSQTRDYVFVGDVVEANVKALDASYTGPLNIGTSVETDVLGLYGLLKDISGAGIGKVHGPPKAGEQKRSLLSYNKAKQVLGWEPQTGLEEGLSETYEWFGRQSHKK